MPRPRAITQNDRERIRLLASTLRLQADWFDYAARGDYGEGIFPIVQKLGQVSTEATQALEAIALEPQEAPGPGRLDLTPRPVPNPEARPVITCDGCHGEKDASTARQVGHRVYCAGCLSEGRHMRAGS